MNRMWAEEIGSTCNLVHKNLLQSFPLCGVFVIVFNPKLIREKQSAQIYIVGLFIRQQAHKLQEALMSSILSPHTKKVKDFSKFKHIEKYEL